MADANLSDKLNRVLPGPVRDALAAVERHAARGQLALFVVGGSVRDLLLDRPSLDIDLTVEGNALALARSVAEAHHNIRCVVHSAFRTATLKAADFRLDIATARSETYERPGALPTVHPGSLADDLRRRDFTVNAMALALTGNQRGTVVDPFAGRADLETGLIRVLHERSFRDDATRILRATRYESRLGFRLEPETLRWLGRDVAYLDAISGQRIRDELLRTLREPQPERTLLRLHQLGALAAIHPGLSFDIRQADAFAVLRDVQTKPTLTAYLALLVWNLSPQEATALTARLALNKRQSEAVRAVAKVTTLERQLSTEPKPSRAVELLSSFPSAVVWALAAMGKEATREQALRYLHRLRYVKPHLDGHALLAMGAPAGPRLGEALRHLKVAKLDGEVRSRRDEERMARDLLGLGARARK